MASVQMTNGLSEQEAGLFGGLFSAQVEGDGDGAQFSDTLQQTLAAFNQAMVEGEEISADWLESLQQQLGDEGDLNALLAKLGLSLPSDESGQIEPDVKQMLVKPDNSIDLAPESEPVTDENGNVLVEFAPELPTAPDSPDNMLDLLAWSEKTLQPRVTDADVVAEVVDNSLVADEEPLFSSTTKVIEAPPGEDSLLENSDELIKTSVNVDWAMAEASDPNLDQETAGRVTSELTLDAALQSKDGEVEVDEPTANTLSHGGGFLAPEHPDEQVSVTPLAAAQTAATVNATNGNPATVFSDTAFNQLHAKANKGAPTGLTASIATDASSESGEESKHALFEALSSGSDDAALDGEAEQALAPIAKAVANSELGARAAEPLVSAIASTPTATGAERIDFGMTPQHQQTSQQTPVQQARADIQTLLQQAVDIRQQEQAAGQLRERMMLMVAGGLNRAEIRLDPPELGSMMVRVQVQNEQAQVQIVTQNQQAKEMLEQTLPRLRELLQQQGIALGDTEVSQQQSQQQQMEDSESDPALAWEQAQDEMLEAEIDIPVIQRQIAQGRVDYFA
ncbi:flagellar hook-length control protein FliK [Corallincola spongiicola]|uniref:Flagellar hook-length control protein FliK n=1 Tax=Corallincola spongiicola TaxID=2520508 RepID=A0ABY1WKK5_9GAMM|nr:flagellar hook-length control protein FliK [Corallincola spongiicola]TAA40312.1 flagellar hook-length control protein FliK [Corallincola spongiicola]